MTAMNLTRPNESPGRRLNVFPSSASADRLRLLAGFIFEAARNFAACLEPQLGKSAMVGAPAFMRGSSAFKPSGSRRPILLRLQPRGFGIFSPTLQMRRRDFLGCRQILGPRHPTGQGTPGLKPD